MEQKRDTRQHVPRRQNGPNPTYSATSTGIKKSTAEPNRTFSQRSRYCWAFDLTASQKAVRWRPGALTISIR